MADLKKYRGSSYAIYEDIATRGNDFLGINLQYAQHPKGDGFVIVRFVARGKDLKPFTHFKKRQSASYIERGPKGEGLAHTTVFRGKRLNKVAIPLFSPAVKLYELEKFGTEYQVWGVIGSWIAEQVKAEGYTLEVADIAAKVKELLCGNGTDPSKVKLTLEFPDLTADTTLEIVEQEHDASDDAEDEDDETIQ